MGNSSRPHFHIKSRDPAEKIEEAEGFFIDAFEEWRKEKKIDKMILLVHYPLLSHSNFRGILLVDTSA
jgi:cardiolipin-specific phospholipase